MTQYNPTTKIEVLRTNPTLPHDCVSCVSDLYGKVYNDLIQIEDKSELEKIMGKSNKEPVDMCYLYIKTLISKIKETNSYNIYKSLYKDKLFEKHLPPKYFFEDINDDTDFALDTEDNIHVAVDNKDIFTNEMVNVKEMIYSDFWLILTHNTFGYMNIDDLSMQVMGNVILKIMSSFKTIFLGQKWMNEHRNDDIEEIEYFSRFVCHLTAIILTDLQNTYPNKNRHTTHDMITVILNNKEIKEFL